MGAPIPRFVRWTVVLAVVAALLVAVFQYWNVAQRGAGAVAGADAVTQTPWGPLGPADRTLLIKVRQAGLWEMPTGQQAQQQGSAARVREVGGMIAAEHADLDARTRNVAAQLGVPLPTQPSAQQQGWMNEIASKSGSDFDRTFVQRLRQGHGIVLPVIAQVRAGTRNELVRRFAITAAQFVNRHMDYLESTGLVDYSALPQPPASSGSTPQVPPVAAAPPAPPAPAAPPAVQAPSPAPVSAVGSAVPTGAAPWGHAEHGYPVPSTPQVTSTAVTTTASSTGGANVIVAALVYLAALLAVVGLLTLAGTASLRARRTRSTRRRAEQVPPRNRRPPQRPTTAHRIVPARPRHAAQRW